MTDWNDANQAYLLAALERVQAAVERREPSSGDTPQEIAARMDVAPALERVADVFGLSAFERDVLLLCAGMELDAGFRAAVRQADGPTFSVALAALDGAHWSALTPSAPLRYWRMVELGPGDGLVSCPLRIDERVLHYLAGVSHPDERLRASLRPATPPAELPATQIDIVERIAARLSDATVAWTAVQLCGEDDAGLQDVAAAAAALGALGLDVLYARDISIAAADRDLMARLCDREAGLSGSALLVVVDDGAEQAVLHAAADFVERAQCPVLVAGREPLRMVGQPLARFDVAKPDGGEQCVLWRQALGPLGERLDGHVDELVNQFNMGGAAIAAASAVVRARALPEDDVDAAAAALWDTCRAQSRSRLDDLAQRIEADASWEDLVLAAPEMAIMHDIVAQVRHRRRVYDTWGFASKSSRGLGISALFCGPSGTGKTLAAEIMASKLRLDLYRIDLSQVVSKYIGETEKNLRRVFDAAETAGAVLLFDEADALFGKRSEVKDSHDRYANIEVSYLLQRMEAYRGLAILTTNMRSALDPAFTRRIRFVLQFPFPDAEHRAEIWRRMFPAATPTAQLDADRLARLNVAGGNIRNIALGAAFAAAEDEGPVSMAHVLRAARAEYAKLDRPLTAAEIAGWVA